MFELHAALDAPVIDRALAHAQPGGPNSGFEGGLYFKTSDGPASCSDMYQPVMDAGASREVHHNSARGR